MWETESYVVKLSYLFFFFFKFSATVLREATAQCCAVSNNALKEYKLTQPLTPLLTFPVALWEGKFAYMWKWRLLSTSRKKILWPHCCTYSCLLNGVAGNGLGLSSSAGRATVFLGTQVCIPGWTYVYLCAQGRRFTTSMFKQNKSLPDAHTVSRRGITSLS